MQLDIAESGHKFARDGDEMLRAVSANLSKGEQRPVARAATIYDLNSMLSAIASGIELLKTCSDDTTSSVLLKNIERTNASARQLASRLLAEQRSLERARIDVGEALARLSTEIKSRLPETILLSVRTWQGLPPIVADPIEFEAALLNLVDNAVDAMPDGGVVTIDARPSRGRVLIAVADNGSGMDRETLKRAQTPFFTTKPAKGAGLGLMQVRRFAAQLGGRLVIKSVPGKRSVFVLNLPECSQADTHQDPL